MIDKMNFIFSENKMESRIVSQEYDPIIFVAIIVSVHHLSEIDIHCRSIEYCWSFEVVIDVSSEDGQILSKLVSVLRQEIPLNALHETLEPLSHCRLDVKRLRLNNLLPELCEVLLVQENESKKRT